MRSNIHDHGSVVFAPDALLEMSLGFCELASLLATTFGPRRGPIWHATGSGVELLSNSAIIARRMVEIPDRLRNTGAMQLRHMVWRMHEYFGDGGATAAVLARAMVASSTKLMAANIDPVALRRGLESSLPVVINALEAQRLPTDSATTERLVSAILPDPGIAAVLAEMIDILGSDAVIHLEVMTSHHLDRIYVEGGHWKIQPSDRTTLPAGSNERVLDSPHVLVADDTVLEPDDLLPALEIIAASRRPLVIVGAKLTTRAQEMLSHNIARGTVAAYAVSPSAVGPARHQMLADIALSTGAELVSSLRGFSPGSLQPSWLGTARQIVLKRDSFTVLEGGGDAARIQGRVREIREQIARSVQPDDTARLRERLAGLAGGIGILQIGGLTQAERDDKRRNIERVIRVLPELVESGVVPGGGLALLACRSVLQEHRDSFGSSEERFGVDIVSRALEAPFLQLVTNCNGMEPEVALQRVTESDYCLTFDARSGALVPSSDTAFTDSLAVMRGALRMATSAVSELITTGTAVLPKERNRSVSTEP